MTCLSCQSVQQHDLTAEMLVHFPRLKNVDNRLFGYSPSYWSAWIAALRGFSVPEKELALLASGSLKS
jgi:hypothetical protein